MRNTERRSFFNWRYVPGERRKRNKRWAVLLLLSIPAFLFFERYVASTGRVTDVSMLPTLTPGNYFLINKYSPRLFPLQRGDVVIVRFPDQPRWYYVKRVVALGGETFSLSGGRVIVDGRPLEEPYVSGRTEPEMKPLRIPEGSYFLMGDNRPNSEDSRVFGTVPREKIEGKIKPGSWFTFR